MARWGVWGVMAVAAMAVGCAGQQQATKARPARAEAVAAQPAPSKPAQALATTVSLGTERRYVDPDLGFEIARPAGDWQLEANEERTPEGLAIPVVLRHKEGAQVVLQVAPAVATPTQFAEKLTTGLRTRGVTTTDPEPIELAEGAVGFRFVMGERVSGRVAIFEGAKGQVFMMMATWPNGSPDNVNAGVQEIFKSIKTVPQT
ncbi:MAG TPA: hypothetical protein VK447_19450 [Myxococcaceae bacterium]|nr:hypothetical protein [Myxococcaceae bacterium]